MASSNALQERQIVLMEAMNRRLESIQEGQKKLEETNAALRKENDLLKTQIERQQSTSQSRRFKRKQPRTSVEIPSDLAVSATVLFIVLLGCVCVNYRYVFTEPKISRQFKIFTRTCLEQTAILLMLIATYVGLWRA